MVRLIQYTLFPIFLLAFSFALALEWVNIWLHERGQLRPLFPAGYLAAGVVVALDVLGLLLDPARAGADVLAGLSTEVFTGLRIFLFVTLGLLTCARLGLPGLPWVGRLFKIQLQPPTQAEPALQSEAFARTSLVPALVSALAVAGVGLAYSFLLFTLVQPTFNPNVPEGLQGSSLIDRGLLSLGGAAGLAGSVLAEELIFRLGIQSWLLGLVPRLKLSARWTWAALGLTALAWTAGYVSLDPDWVKPLQIFPLALGLGWLARRHGVAASILAHLLFSLGSIGILSGLIR